MQDIWNSGIKSLPRKLCSKILFFFPAKNVFFLFLRFCFLTVPLFKGGFVIVWNTVLEVYSVKFFRFAGLLALLLLLTALPVFAQANDSGSDGAANVIRPADIAIKQINKNSFLTAKQAVAAKRLALNSEAGLVLRSNLRALKDLRGSNAPEAVAERLRLKNEIAADVKLKLVAHSDLVKAKLAELELVVEVSPELVSKVDSLSLAVPSELAAGEVVSVSADYAVKWREVRRELRAVALAAALKRADAWLSERALPLVSKLKATKLYSENAGFKERVDKLDVRVTDLKAKIAELEGKDLSVAENFQAAKRVVLQTRVVANRLNAFFNSVHVFFKNRLENKASDILSVNSAADAAVSELVSVNLSTEVTAADTTAAANETTVENAGTEGTE